MSGEIKDTRLSDHLIADRAARLTDKLNELCTDEPSASVFIAMANMLGHMEMHSKRKDRLDLFRVLGNAMDDYVARHTFMPGS